jgi:hypothetical protein
MEIEKYKELKAFHRLTKDLLNAENSDGADFAPSLEGNEELTKRIPSECLEFIIVDSKENDE